MSDEEERFGVPAVARREVSADAPTAPDGTSMHLGLAPGSVSPFCIVVGDPERTEAQAERWMDALEGMTMVRKRGYCTATGRTQGGLHLTIGTHHIASGAARIAFEELVWGGARVVVRVGSSSALREGVQIGDTLIWEAALRRDGASNAFAPPGMPAYATPEAVLALVEAARANRTPYHRGWGVTTTDFFQDQGRPGLLGFVPEETRARIAWEIAVGAFGFEMEMATLFAYAQAHTGAIQMLDGGGPGLLCGGVTAVFANRRGKGGTLAEQGVDAAFQIALGGMLRLAALYETLKAGTR